MRRVRGPGVATNAALLLAGGVSARFLSFVGFWLFTHVLSRADVGVISLALSVGAMCFEPGDGGLDPMVVRALTRAHGREARRFGAALVAKALYGSVGLLVAVAVLSALVADSASRRAVWLVVGGWWLGSFGRTLSAVFAAHEQFVWKGLLDLGRSTTLALGGALLWLAHGPLVAAGLVHGVAEVVQAGFTVGVHRARFRRVVPRFDARLALLLARQAWLPSLSALASMIYLVGDRVVLWRFAGRAEVGVYEAVSRVPLAFAVLPAALASAAFPAIAGRDRERARRIYRETLVVLVTLAVPLAVGGAVLADAGVALLYPADYAAAARPFAAIWMVVGAVIFVSYVPSASLLALGRTVELSRITAALAAGNILLNLMVDPWFGTRGAASVMLATQAAGLVAYSRIAGRELGLAGPWRVLRPGVLVASAVSGLVAWYVPGPVLIRAGAGVAAYAAALVALGAWPREAIATLREAADGADAARAAAPLPPLA